MSISRRRAVRASLAGAVATALGRPLAGAAAAGETLWVPFSLGTAGVTTQNTYAGSVTVIVSGVGQAASTQTSDAFYIFTDPSGEPVEPWHLAEYYNFGLWVNGGPVDDYVDAIPPYQENHIYSFPVRAYGRITFAFGVGDADTSDNTGGFTVTVLPGNRH